MKIGPIALTLVLLGGFSLGHAQATFTDYLAGGVRPTAITTGPDGNLWFSTEATSPYIGRMTPAGGLTLFPCLSQNSEGGITSGPDGNVWFVEYRDSRIGRMTLAGQATDFPIPGGRRPRYIASDGTDLWFTTNEAFLGRITTAGIFTMYAIPSGNQTHGICKGPNGEMWFTENTGHAIGKIDALGVISEFPLPQAGHYPYLITMGPDNNLWFTDPNAYNGVGRITSTGVFTFFTNPTPGAGPIDICVGPDNSLWFTQTDGNKLGRITTDGIITEFPIPTHGAGSGISLGSDGNIWFGIQTAEKIVRAHISPFALPLSVTVTQGFVFDGEVTSLLSSNDQDLRIFPDPDSLIGQVQIDSVSPVQTPSSITFTLEAAVGRPGLSQQVALYNYVSNHYVTLFGAVAPSADVTYQVNATNPAANFIGPGGVISVEITWAPINDEEPSQDGWPLDVDMARWTME